MNFTGDKQAIIERAKRIKLLLLDVDGVLTDGKLYYSGNGEELKAFNTLDGHGIKLLQRASIQTGIVSGRNSAALVKRASELGIEILYRGREDKLLAVEEIMGEYSLELSDIAFAGDDLPDLPAIQQVGLGISVPNAHAEIRAAAQLETEKPGGSGAVRDICDFLLQAQGFYDDFLQGKFP